MLQQSIFGTTIYFLINILASFIFFSTSLLHFDSLKLKNKNVSLKPRGVGFLLLSFAYIILAIYPNNTTFVLFSSLLVTFSLILILISLFNENILKKPLSHAILGLPLIASAPLFTKFIVHPQNFLLASAISIFYFVRSIKGLDKQLKPLFFGFIFLGFHFILQAINITENIHSLYFLELFREFGIVWYLSLISLLTSSLIIGVWSWNYIRFRTGIQIFIITTASILTVFSISAILFNSLVINIIQEDTITKLETDVKLMRYTLENTQLASLSITESIAKDSEVILAVINSERTNLIDRITKEIEDKRINYFIVIDKNSEVLFRTSDENSFGDTLSGTIPENILSGQKLSLIESDEGPIYPTVKIKSGIPIYDQNSNVVGGIISESYIDNSFADGIKSFSGLDISIFADNYRSATTILSEDGVTRFLGTELNNSEILNKINQSKIYSGEDTILNIPYFSAYIPLTTYNDKVVGILSVSSPQINLLNTLQDNIDKTFEWTGLLILISILPAYFLSRFIERNINA